MKKAKMICAKCGAEMNHHADKVDYDADDALSIDPAFDGVVEEVHTFLTVAVLHRGRLN